MSRTTEQRPLERLSQAELDEVLRRHEMYRKARMGGARAVLSFFDMSGLDLSGRDLTDADLAGSILAGADLEGSDL